MKQSIFFILMTFLLLISCNKEDEVVIPSCEDCDFTCIEEGQSDVITNNCKDNWECAFTFEADSKVDTDVHLGSISGDKLVFQMINSTQGDLTIADDEYTNILIFELDQNQTSFSVEDIDVQNMKVHHKTDCYCLNVEFITPTSGCLQGELQDDGNWFVQGNLSFEGLDGTNRVLVDAQFVEK